MKTKLAITAIVIGVLAANLAVAATLQIIPSSATVNVGDILNVQIVVDSQGQSIDGVDINALHYDPSLLQIQDSGNQITPTALFDQVLLNTVDSSLGNIIYSAIANNAITGIGAIANITFKALSAGTANLIFDFTPNSTTDSNLASDGTDLLSGATNGQYSIVNPSSNSSGASSGSSGSSGGSGSGSSGGSGGSYGGSSSSGGGGGNSSSSGNSGTSGGVSTTTNNTNSGNSSTATAFSSTSSSTKLIRFSNNSKIYTLEGKQIKWVPSIAVFNQLGLNWKNVTVVSPSKASSYKRASLLRAEGDTMVYYITENGFKRHIPNAVTFLSYNDKWSDIVTVKSFELSAIPDNILIKQTGKPEVYRLENDTVKWIKTAEAFARLGLKWNEIAPVNSTELNSYTKGTPIE